MRTETRQVIRTNDGETRSPTLGANGPWSSIDSMLRMFQTHRPDLEPRLMTQTRQVTDWEDAWI